jgi:transcriptional regulator with XRE-family HTH domain
MANVRELFGKNCKQRMATLGINQTDLAKKLEIAPSMVSSYVNGKIEPGLDLIERWAEKLECTPAELIAEPALEAADNPKLALIALILTLDDSTVRDLSDFARRYTALNKKKLDTSTG